jgi:hypothetical protein
MRIFPNRVAQRVGLGVAVALLLALVAWLHVRVAGARQLAVARDRFEVEVGPLPVPGIARSTASEKREPAAFLQRLGGPARLPAPADLMHIRQLYVRAPSTWSAAEVDECRRFLAANASLRVASDRAAERRGTAFVGARVDLPWEPADTGPLLTRAGAQASLLKARIRLALHDRSSAEMRRGMEALAAEVEAFRTEPGALFLLMGLPQEKSLLQATAWVVEDRDVDPRDLAAIQRLLPRRQPMAAAVRHLAAGEAGYLVASNIQLGRPWNSDANLAQVLDGYRRLVLELEAGRPGKVRPASLRESRTAARPQTVPALILDSVRPNFEDVVEQIAAISAASQLAELALDLRLGATQGCAYPATLASLPLAREPDPFTARRPRYQRDAQGGALLSNPSAAAAWDASPHSATTKPPPYAWRLPPPCASAAPSPGSSL